MTCIALASVAGLIGPVLVASGPSRASAQPPSNVLTAPQRWVRPATFGVQDA
jgi:hypothetical protein